MDCIGLQQSSFPHIFVTSKSPHSPHSHLAPIPPHKPSKLAAWCALGSSDTFSDDTYSSTNPNLNASLFDQSSDESTPAPFGTLEAQITQETIDFFVSDAEGDPDCPSPGYSPIDQALSALRRQKFVLVVDDYDGDDHVEGNLIMAASHVSSEAVAFMVRNGSGIISVGMKEEDLQRLDLPLMSPQNEDNSSAPSFTVPVV